MSTTTTYNHLRQCRDLQPGTMVRSTDTPARLGTVSKRYLHKNGDVTSLAYVAVAWFDGSKSYNSPRFLEIDTE